MAPGIGNCFRIAGIQGQIELTFEGESGERGENDNDASVDDVPAVASAITSDQTRQRDKSRFPVHLVTRVDTLVELLDDSRRNQAAEGVRQQGRQIVNAQRKCENPYRSS